MANFIKNFDTVTNLNRECIRQVCEKVDQTSLIQERRDSKVYRYIQNTLKVVYSGSHAALNVSRTKLSLKTFKTNEEIAKHDLSRISFASCGTDSVNLTLKPRKMLHFCSFQKVRFISEYIGFCHLHSKERNRMEGLLRLRM